MLLYLAVDKSSPDEQEFITKLYQRFLPAMVATASKYVSNQHDAEDVVHSAVVRLIPNIDKLMKLNDFTLSAYVFYTTRSVALNLLRHQNVVHEHTAAAADDASIDNIKDSSALPEIKFLDKEAAEQFAEIFTTLPEEDQLLLSGKYILELSDQELANILNCKVSSIRMKLTRARRRAQGMFLKGGYVHDRIGKTIRKL